MPEKRKFRHVDGTEKYEYLHNGVWYPEYCAKSENDILHSVKRLREMLSTFCKLFGYQIQDMSVDEELLIECLSHADHRMLHYKIYHDLDTDELKEASALCYWLTQYKPISRKKSKANGSTFYTVGAINEAFALYISVRTVVSQWTVNGVRDKRKMNRDTIHDLIYTLQHRMSSYDSLAIILKTLAM